MRICKAGIFQHLGIRAMASNAPIRIPKIAQTHRIGAPCAAETHKHTRIDVGKLDSAGLVSLVAKSTKTTTLAALLLAVPATRLGEIPEDTLTNVFYNLSKQSHPDTHAAATHLFANTAIRNASIYTSWFNLVPHTTLPVELDECLDMSSSPGPIHALLQSLTKAGALAPQVDLLRRMARRGIRPNVFTLNQFIRAWSTLGDLSPHKLWNWLSNVPPSSPTVPSEWIVQFFKNVQPDAYTFTILIDMLLKSSTHFTRSALFALMRTHGVKPNAYHLNQLLVRASESGNDGEFRELFALFDAVETKPTPKSLALWLEHHAARRKWVEFESALSEFWREYPQVMRLGPGYGLSAETWSLPLLAHKASSLPVLQHYLATNPHPTLAPLFLVKAHAEAGDIPTAVSVACTLNTHAGLAWSFIFSRLKPEQIPELWKVAETTLEAWGEETHVPLPTTLLFANTVVRGFKGLYAEALTIPPAANPIYVMMRCLPAGTDALSWMMGLQGTAVASKAVDLALSRTRHDFHACVSLIASLAARHVDVTRFWIHVARFSPRFLRRALAQLTRGAQRIGLGLLFQRVLLTRSYAPRRISGEMEAVCRAWVGQHGGGMGDLARVSWCLYTGSDPVPTIGTNAVVGLLLLKAFASQGRVDTATRIGTHLTTLRLSTATRHAVVGMLAQSHTRELSAAHRRGQPTSVAERLRAVERAWNDAVLRNTGLGPTANLRMDALHYACAYDLADAFYAEVVQGALRHVVGANFYVSYVECLQRQGRVDDIVRVVQEWGCGDKMLLRALGACIEAERLDAAKRVLSVARPDLLIEGMSDVMKIYSELK